MGCAKLPPVAAKTTGPSTATSPVTRTPAAAAPINMLKVVPSVAVEESWLSALTPPTTPLNVTLPAVFRVSERAVASRLSTVELKTMFWELVSLSVVSALSSTPSVYVWPKVVVIRPLLMSIVGVTPARVPLRPTVRTLSAETEPTG